jgi:hypothetical protein
MSNLRSEGIKELSSRWPPDSLKGSGCGQQRRKFQALHNG